jgi:hypothetical protein
MSARILITAATLSLLAAAPASAKELGSVAICGADGCVDRTGRATHAVVEGGARRAAPRAAEPYYVVRIGVAEERGGKVVHRFDTRWLPKAGLLRGADGVWMSAPAKTRRELMRLTRGIEPRPAGSRPPKEPPQAPIGQLPPEVMEPPAAAEEDRGGGGGPSTALVAAPAALLLGAAAFAARRRRRSRRA